MFILSSRHTLVFLVVNALIGSVLSDFLWSKSVVLTSALIGTIILSLTIPLALVCDAVFKHMKITPYYMLGVALVITGFILVNAEHAMRQRAQSQATDFEKHQEQDGDDV